MTMRVRRLTLAELFAALAVASGGAVALALFARKRPKAGSSEVAHMPAALEAKDTVVAHSTGKSRFLPWLVPVVCVGIAAVLGWLREPVTLRLDPPLSGELEKFRLMPNGISGAPPEVDFVLGRPYETSAYNLAQGKRLYAWFGCPSCHGDGRGANAPSFLDGWWLYGPEMVSIVSSIRDGRPHGMPSFQDRMTIDQIWQLAGYVQTVGAYKARLGAPGRSDAGQTRPAENRLPASKLFDPGPAGVNPEQGPSP